MVPMEALSINYPPPSDSPLQKNHAGGTAVILDFFF